MYAAVVRTKLIWLIKGIVAFRVIGTYHFLRRGNNIYSRHNLGLLSVVCQILRLILLHFQLHRFRLCTVCSDNTGIIAIVFPDDEIQSILGKNVFEIENDDEQVCIVLFNVYGYIIFVSNLLKILLFAGW